MNMDTLLVEAHTLHVVGVHAILKLCAMFHGANVMWWTNIACVGHGVACDCRVICKARSE